MNAQASAKSTNGNDRHTQLQSEIKTLRLALIALERTYLVEKAEIELQIAKIQFQLPADLELEQDSDAHDLKSESQSSAVDVVVKVEKRTEPSHPIEEKIRNSMQTDSVKQRLAFLNKLEKSSSFVPYGGKKKGAKRKKKTKEKSKAKAADNESSNEDEPDDALSDSDGDTSFLRGIASMLDWHGAAFVQDCPPIDERMLEKYIVFVHPPDPEEEGQVYQLMQVHKYYHANYRGKEKIGWAKPLDGKLVHCNYECKLVVNTKEDIRLESRLYDGQGILSEEKNWVVVVEVDE